MNDQLTSRRIWLARTAAAGTSLCLGPLAHSQAEWPSRPIKFIVPYSAGGATDIVARLIGEKVSARLGQPVVIDNRTGAGGILGTDATAKAAPDGYTFAVSLGTSLLTNQFLYEKLPYDVRRDLALVSQIVVAPLTLAVHPSLPVATGPELLQYVASHKGKLSYGSWGVGSPAHLSGAYMSLTQQAEMAHVAYKGEAPMLQDLIGGQIQMAFASALGTKAHADAGRLRLIGVTGEQRMGVLPNLPTLQEQGLKDDAYRVVSFIGMAAPAKTPTALVERMAREVASACQLPELRERIVAMGFIPAAGTPQAFAAAYKKDYVVLEKLVKDSGAKLD